MAKLYLSLFLIFTACKNIACEILEKWLLRLYDSNTRELFNISALCCRYSVSRRIHSKSVSKIIGLYGEICYWNTLSAREFTVSTVTVNLYVTPCRRLQNFRSNILPPFLEFKSKPSLISCLLGLLFDPENRDSTFLQNVCNLLQHYVAFKNPQW
jgi:hypothetical protein